MFSWKNLGLAYYFLFCFLKILKTNSFGLIKSAFGEHLSFFGGEVIVIYRPYDFRHFEDFGVTF